MSDTEFRLKAIIVDKLSINENDLELNTSFKNDLGADSLDMVELIMEFEREFAIIIPDDEHENLKTVGQIISYINKAV